MQNGASVHTTETPPGKPDSISKLVEFLGYDPTKESPTSDILDAAMKKINEDRAKKLQGRVEELLVKAIEVAQKKKKLVNEFRAQDAKWEKELGKILGQIGAIRHNRELPPEEPEEKKEAGNKDAAAESK